MSKTTEAIRMLRQTETRNDGPSEPIDLGFEMPNHSGISNHPELQAYISNQIAAIPTTPSTVTYLATLSGNTTATALGDLDSVTFPAGTFGANDVLVGYVNMETTGTAASIKIIFEVPQTPFSSSIYVAHASITTRLSGIVHYSANGDDNTIATADSNCIAGLGSSKLAVSSTTGDANWMTQSITVTLQATADTVGGKFANVSIKLFKLSAS